jgi:hypothetical protein
VELQITVGDEFNFREPSAEEMPQEVNNDRNESSKEC